MSNIGWMHPFDTGDQWDGFNEPGIEHFAGSPIRHLAREVVQNSLDSHDQELVAPVRVKIEQTTIKTSEIPGLEELKATFTLCLNSSDFEGPKAKKFFESALKDLEKSRVKILSISDFNTKGMRGPVKNGTPYYAFMKAKGQSQKSTETAGGSFGIGKFAPYAVSRLRTVFVSTAFQADSGDFMQYTQGKSILMSHDDESSNRHQAVGFWGIREKCQPIVGQANDLPVWLARAPANGTLADHVGTRLVILGFEGQAGWQESLAASIAENFFGAIHSKKLEVVIDEKYLINSTSIKDVLDNKDIAVAIINEKNEPEQYSNSRDYYDCLVSHDDVFIEQTQNLNLGLCELKILVREGLPKKVAFLRNGMFISDTLKVAGLKNFSEFKDFVAVFQCKDNKGIELLRAMEPPRHDDFEPERLPSKEEQAKALKALKDMATWIRDMLRRRAKDPISEVTKLDELKEFFADDSDDGKGNGIEETNPFGAIVIKAKPISHKKQKAFDSGDGSANTGKSNDGEGGGGRDGGGGGDGEGGAGTDEGGTGGGGNVRPTAPLSNPRTVITALNTRKVSFTPLADGKYEIGLLEVGADSEYHIAIKGASAGEVHAGKVRISAQKGVRLSLDIELGESFEGAMKVVAHEV